MPVNTSRNITNILERLSNYWQDNSAIHNSYGEYDNIEFAPEKKDFSESLLPFSSHESWLNAPEDKKSKCLSYAWILYNMKTIYIECDIVTPVCEKLLKDPFPSDNTILVQRVISEALLDEALHTKMSIASCNYIYEHRNLPRLGKNEFLLIDWLSAQVDKASSREEEELIRFSVACASETLITEYLATLANDDSIQKICNEVTTLHLADERSHSGVFTNVALDMLRNASKKDIDLFTNTVLETIPIFADNEMKEWEKVFQVVGLPDYEKILVDTSNLKNIDIYSTSVNRLFKRLGVSF